MKAQFKNQVCLKNKKHSNQGLLIYFKGFFLAYFLYNQYILFSFYFLNIVVFICSIHLKNENYLYTSLLEVIYTLPYWKLSIHFPTGSYLCTSLLEVIYTLPYWKLSIHLDTGSYQYTSLLEVIYTLPYWKLSIHFPTGSYLHTSLLEVIYTLPYWK